MFFSDEGPTLETLDFAICLSAVHQPFSSVTIFISTLPMQHTSKKSADLIIIDVYKHPPEQGNASLTKCFVQDHQLSRTLKSMYFLSN